MFARWHFTYHTTTKNEHAIKGIGLRSIAQDGNSRGGPLTAPLGEPLAERSGCRAFSLLLEFLLGLPWEIDRKGDPRA